MFYYYEIIEYSLSTMMHFIEWLCSDDPNQNAEIILKSFLWENGRPDAWCLMIKYPIYYYYKIHFISFAGSGTGNVNLVTTYIYTYISMF